MSQQRTSRTKLLDDGGGHNYSIGYQHAPPPGARRIASVPWDHEHHEFGWRDRLEVCFRRRLLFLHGTPFLQMLPFLSLHHVVLATTMALIFVGTWRSAFVGPSTEDSGFWALYAIALTFFLANKSTSFLLLKAFGVISWERLVPLHYAAAALSVVLSCLHGYTAYSTGGKRVDERNVHDSEYYSRVGPDPNWWMFLWDGRIHISGCAMIGCMSALVGSSALRWFRKRNYDVWLMLHLTLSVGFVVLAIVHAIAAVGFILAWWMLDLIVRYAVRSGCRYPKTAVVTKILPDVVELRFPRGNFRYRAGQFLRIAVLENGILQFHPVTISSAPFEKDVTVHFRGLGDWTRRLQDISMQQGRKVDVFVEGPYGSLFVDLDNHQRYPRVLLICAGIGVTPMLSVARQLIHEHQYNVRQRCRIQIVWAVRDLALVEALPFENKSSTGVDELQPMSSGSCEEGELVEDILHVDIYVTKKSMNPNIVAKTQDLLISNDPRYTVHNGCRPDVHAILESASKQVRNRPQSCRVAVLVCGPSSLVEAAKVACVERSGSGVMFDFREEVFDF